MRRQLVSLMLCSTSAMALPAFAGGVFEDDRIELHTGDSVTGTIVERTNEHVVIDHAVLGRLTIPLDQIASLPEPEEGEAAAEQQEVADLEEQEESEWESRLDVGIAGSQGNTETLDVRIAFESLNETDIARWRFDASYFYGETEGEKNKSQATAGVLRDWLFEDSPWSIFATARYDYDEFRDWTHRLSGHAGFGYEFIDNDEFQLIGRVGAGAAKEWKRSDSLRPEGLLGLEFRWNVSDRQKLTAHSTLYPDLGDFFEYRAVSGVQWTMALDTANGLNLSAGIDHEYESETDPGIKNSDLNFYAGLSLLF